MKINETIVYPFPPDAVHRMQTDQACREEACRESRAVEYAVMIKSEGGNDVVQVDRKMAADIPDFVRRFTGDHVNVRQIETWPATPDARGGRVGKVRVTIKGQPASMDATITVTPDGARTRAELKGEVKVNVPLIGRKIEPEIARAILGALHVDQRVGIAWLEAHA